MDDDTDPVAKLTLGDLLAWGREFERLWSEGIRRIGTGDDGKVFHRYQREANEALELRVQGEQARERASSRRIGRPPGTAGEQMARLIDARVPELEALSATKNANNMSADAVLRSYDAARKKPPLEGGEPTKNPPPALAGPQKTPLKQPRTNKKPP